MAMAMAMAALAETGRGGDGDSEREEDDQSRHRGKALQEASVSDEDEGGEYAEVEDGSSDRVIDKDNEDVDDNDDDDDDDDDDEEEEEEEEKESGGSEQDEEEDEEEEGEEDENLADIVAQSIASRLRGMNSETSTVLAMEEDKRRREIGVSLLTSNGSDAFGKKNEGKNAMLRWFPDTGIALPGMEGEGEGEKNEKNAPQRLAVIDRRPGGGGEEIEGIEKKKTDSKRAVRVHQSAMIARTALEEAMAASSIDVRLDSALEKRFTVPPPDPKKERRTAMKSAPKTAGSKWFDLPAPQLTPELRRELQLIRLRAVIDPKRHYKTTNDKREPYPTYFQIGKVIEGPTEFYSSRLTKKQRKQTMAEEILADEAVTAYRKRKFQELQKTKMAGGSDQYKAKFMKRKKPWARH
ncbi:hypothetical protein CBR_g41139 [Chara braunii]|uniref:Fcf2 pre-rRNA processing C-terminal domain-containing protein n=1 Tax=Chara braunii TaxID=69332 RepID=A0A388LV76_CHABU|nr:hypothetical protein CBR_g41139 [Chara braunii]|eukprot:GBG86234.1 hypothetical protein CBR_g41139 [Chara braunii]